MLEPLDPETLDLLLRDGDDPGCGKISAARYFFQKQDLAQGVEALLQAFRIFNPYLFYEEKDDLRDWHKWHIDFYEAPFDSLQIRPADGNIEIFEHEKRVKSYAGLDCPQSWILMLRWLWAYGEETYIINVMNGFMIRPLDPSKLAALARVDGSGQFEVIQGAKEYLRNEKDLANFVSSLFEGWEVFTPRLHRDREQHVDWHLTFRNSPFRSLQIQPSVDRGVVDVYAFNVKVTSFHIIDNPYVADAEMWQRLLRWTWDYGRRRLVQKQKSQATQCLLPKTHAKSQRNLKRTDKPLIRKVLTTASFKAQHGANIKAKETKVISRKVDVNMENVDRSNVDIPPSRQLPIQKSPLCTTDPNAQSGSAREPKVIGDSRITKVGIEDVNVGSLEIMDQQH